MSLIITVISEAALLCDYSHNFFVSGRTKVKYILLGSFRCLSDRSKIMEIKYVATIIFVYILLRDFFLFFFSRRDCVLLGNNDGKKGFGALDGGGGEISGESYFDSVKNFLLFNNWFNRFLYLVFISIVAHYLILDFVG